jgi:thiamine biosynthesis lipoprotein
VPTAEPRSIGLRTRHVEHVMGTAFSFDVRWPEATDRHAAADAVAAAVGWLHWVDATFSTYRPDSAISRLARGETRPDDRPAEVGEVLGACAQVERTSRGAFSATAAGALDPSGYVKGWAVERAVAHLRLAGAEAAAVNGGGDVRAFGPVPWRVGISDPRVRGRLLAAVEVADGAVATSGSAERGRHVTDPRTGRPAAGLLAVTLVGPDLALADAYATAALVLGDGAAEWVCGLAGYEALGVRPDGSAWTTPGWPGPQGSQAAHRKIPA